jgi:copper chaperone CopZ
MKYLVVLMLVSIVLMGCAESNSTTSATTKSEATPVAFNTAGAPTVKFSVPDMVCESCSAAVQETLAKQPGAKEVIVDLEEKVATVAVDEKSFDEAAAVAALLDKQFSKAKLVE